MQHGKIPPRKILAAWLAMLGIAIANGVVRDFTYGRHMNRVGAHQLSTAAATVLLGLVIRAFVRRHPPASLREALSLGLYWAVLTVAFEFLFFHFIGGRPWPELLAAYRLDQGSLWPLLLLWLVVAPALLRARSS